MQNAPYCDDPNEYDKHIEHIQNSTRTFFPFFIRIHNWLRMKSPAYYRWHLHPMSTVTHLAILSLITIINFANLASMIFAHPPSASGNPQEEFILPSPTHYYPVEFITPSANLNPGPSESPSPSPSSEISPSKLEGSG